MLVQEAITEGIIGAAIAVHTTLGPGLMESVYEECLAEEMSRRCIAFERQARLPIVYRGKTLDGHYRIDFLVENRVIVELKSLDVLLPIHRAQLLTYLRLSGKQVGLILNFNVRRLPSGLVRLVLTG